MAAMAGALDVILAKPGVYSEGRGDEPVAADIGRALGLFRRAIFVALLVVLTSAIAASYR